MTGNAGARCIATLHLQAFLMRAVTIERLAAAGKQRATTAGSGSASQSKAMSASGVASVAVAPTSGNVARRPTGSVRTPPAISACYANHLLG